MCSHYQAIKERERYARHFGVKPLVDLGKYDVWPGYATTFSFSMLTINAEGHELMCQFHKPVDEKRMVVILPPDSYGHWLRTKPEQSMDFMRQYPADRLLAGAEPPTQRSMLA